MQDGDPNYFGTEAEGTLALSGTIKYEHFVDHMVEKHGRYEMLHRDSLVPLDDTLFMEGLLKDEVDGPQYQAHEIHGRLYCFVPVVDVLWARARLEGVPAGNVPVLADVAAETPDVRGDAHAL